MFANRWITSSLPAALLLLASTATATSTEISWPKWYFDPAVIISDEEDYTGDDKVSDADMVLPLPCGGAIAMVRVDTEAHPDDPLDDQRFRMGRAEEKRASLEYIRTAHIRGAFPTRNDSKTHFFIGRYEVTRNQLAAVTAWAGGKPCPEPDDEEGNLPAAGMSWLDAMQFTEDLSTWARGNLAEQMPRAGGKMGFFRLPSEVEWEFATRGGLNNDRRFNESRYFPNSNPVEDYAWFEGTDAEGAPQFVGLLKGNPLGIFDLYGNVEEMVLDLFSLNRGGRRHGQYGGFITRGGSVDAYRQAMNSAFRKEYSLYREGSGEPLSAGNIGFRVVLSNFVQNDDRVFAGAQATWSSVLDSDVPDDPNRLLTDMINEETGLRKTRLQTVQAALVAALQQADEATSLALRRAIFSGATLKFAIDSVQNRKQRVEQIIADLESGLKAYEKDREVELKSAASEAERAEINEYYDDARRRDVSSLEKARRQLNEYVLRLDINGSNFVQTVNAVYESSTADGFAKQRDLLISEMDRGGQLEMVIPINEFSDVVKRFRKNPSMTREQVLAFD